MNEEIFKVQLPLDSNLKSPPALAYNRDHSIEMFIPCTRKLREKVGRQEKSFWYAKVRGGKLDLVRPAEWQQW